MWKYLWKSLRIAVTTVSLIACVLLIVLWVRSYTHSEYLIGKAPLISKNIQLGSYHGFFGIILTRWSRGEAWHYESQLHQDHPFRIEFQQPSWFCEWNGPYVYHQLDIQAPHWFWLTIFATIAALPWIKWRFSLRTLLIVVTLFALFSGAIAMSIRV